MVNIGLLCEDTAGQIVRWCVDGEFLAIFCVLYFSEPHAARFRPASQIRTKATPCVELEVW